jgi:hypothetical protein
MIKPPALLYPFRRQREKVDFTFFVWITTLFLQKSYRVLVSNCSGDERVVTDRIVNLGGISVDVQQI